MEDIIGNLERAYEQLSQIRVAYDDVERMAEAKRELRAAFLRLRSMSAEKKENTNGQTD